MHANFTEKAYLFLQRTGQCFSSRQKVWCFQNDGVSLGKEVQNWLRDIFDTKLKEEINKATFNSHKTSFKRKREDCRPQKADPFRGQKIEGASATKRLLLNHSPVFEKKKSYN